MSLKCENAPQQQCRINRTPSVRFPLLRRGNRATFRFPSRSGGNLKEGGKAAWNRDALIFEGLIILIGCSSASSAGRRRYAKRVRSVGVPPTICTT